MNEAKMNELAQAEDMAYFRADLCLYSPESSSLEEKKEICNDMMSTSKAVLVGDGDPLYRELEPLA
ncbi:MAG: hypothetical protein K5859_01540 [Atopobiaceae bacterium]|nr:hypothetical protein [Atopobiaceae bacterium]